MQIAEDLLDYEFRAAIRIGGGQRKILGEADLAGIAVDGGRRAENELPHAVFLHDLAEKERAGHVVLEVAQRLTHRFAHGLQAREMEHGFAGEAAEDVPQSFAIQQIDPVKRQSSSRLVPARAGATLPCCCSDCRSPRSRVRRPGVPDRYGCRYNPPRPSR